MNPLLVREVHPPLIYVGGDGRLNNTQSIYQYIIFLPLPLSLSLVLLLPHSSLVLHAGGLPIHEALGASKST